jgi:predicted secreted protein
VAITKAKKVIELSRDNRKILVTLYEGNQVSSCVEEAKKKYCETCQCDEKTCQEWVDSLKAKGYQATEVELGELGIEESLPKFLEERETKPSAAIPSEPEVKEEE